MWWIYVGRQAGKAVCMAGQSCGAGQRMAPKGVGKIKTGPRDKGVASMKGRQKSVAGGSLKGRQCAVAGGRMK